MNTAMAESSWWGRLALVAIMTALAACATVPPASIEAGAWLLQTPDQGTEPVEVRLLTESEYYLNAAGHPVAGVYRLEGNQLKMVKPDNPRMSGIVWQLNGDRSLTVVQEPPVANSGQRLISARMVKGS